MIGAVAGLAIGTTVTLYSYSIDYSNRSFEIRIAFALTYGLLIGVYMGLSLGLAIRLDRRIEPMEVMSWSWRGIRRNIVRWLLVGMGIGLVQGLIFAQPFMTSSPGLWLANFLPNGLQTTFQLILAVMLVNGVTRGLSKRVLDAHRIVTPNQGIWHSAHYGLAMAIIIGGLTATFTGVSVFIAKFWLPVHMGIFREPSLTDYWVVSMMSHILRFYPTVGREFWTLDALFWGTRMGAILGLTAGLYCGGAAYVQHFVLRFMLWRARYGPFHYPRFLDYAAERVLLRKVGGGYIFIHRLLLEYFDTTQESDCNRKDSQN